MYTQHKGPLSSLTSFRIGGPADIYTPRTIEDLKSLLTLYPNALILGGGTKLLFPDEGISEPVILMTSLNKAEVRDKEFQAEAGVRLANHFDFIAGVAATAGGALRNNFGAYGYEIGAFVKKVRVVSATEDSWLSRKELCFAYRTSSIKEKKLVVAEVVFEKTQNTHAGPYLRQRKESQPLTLGCAGSIFKNPAGKHAGKLLEECGLKGTKEGGAEIWSKHANFIVNNGTATAANVRDLITLARTAVKKKFNIDLELELQVYGDTNGL